MKKQHLMFSCLASAALLLACSDANNGETSGFQPDSTGSSDDDGQAGFADTPTADSPGDDATPGDDPIPDAADTSSSDPGPEDTGAELPPIADAVGTDGPAEDIAPGDVGPVAPKIETDPMSYTFSYLSPLPSPLTKQINVYSVGHMDLKITSIAWADGSSPDFSITKIPAGLPSIPKVVPPGKQILVEVSFDEIQGGDATLLISSNDPDHQVVEVPFTSYLKGASPEPCAMLTKKSLDFGIVVRGNKGSQQTGVKNCSSTMPLKISQITRSSAFFFPLTEEFQMEPEPSTPLTIQPGDTLPIMVTYAPKLAGLDAGYFVFHTDDPNEPELQLDVKGLGSEPPPDQIGLTIELSWDADSCDVDSHFLEPGGTFSDCLTDCYFSNPAPDWGVQGDWIDDPFLDVDDVDGYGPEHINISEPQPGVYTYIVHYYDDSHDGSFSTDTNATVKVLSYGNLLQTFGPKNLDHTNRTWDVFTIEWPSTIITHLGTMSEQSVSSLCFPSFP